MTDHSPDPVVRPLQERSAVLVVRVWVVQEEQRHLRARVLEAEDSSSDLLSVTAAGSVEEVCAAVRKWLDDFLAG